MPLISNKTIEQIDDLLKNYEFVKQMGLDEVSTKEQMDFMTTHYNEDDIDQFHCEIFNDK